MRVPQHFIKGSSQPQGIPHPFVSGGQTAPDKNSRAKKLSHAARLAAVPSRKGELLAGDAIAVHANHLRGLARECYRGGLAAAPARPIERAATIAGFFEPWLTPAHQDTADLKKARILAIPPIITSLFKAVLNVSRVSFLSSTSSGLLGSNSSIMVTRFRNTTVFFALAAWILHIGSDLSLKTALH
jgi:hypothetical protein